MTRSPIVGTILVIFMGGMVGGLGYLLFIKNNNSDAQAVAQGPYNPNIELTEPSANASADPNAIGGSRKRKGKCKKKKSVRKCKKH